MKKLIVTRHPATVEFIRLASAEWADAPVMACVTADDVRGKVVCGNLPLHLASLANFVIAVEFDGDAPRGAEYTLDDMITAGARLRAYSVSAGRIGVIPQGCGWSDSPTSTTLAGFPAVESLLYPPSDCDGGKYVTQITK